jgi:hypothetical protein
MNSDDNFSLPLYVVLGRISAIWTLANIGYYVGLPFLGFNLSYNTSPFAISIYFFLWIVYGKWFEKNDEIWREVFVSLGLILFSLTITYYFSRLPELDIAIPPYGDLFSASALYFLPKSVEILVQQLLIAVLVLILFDKFKSLKSLMLGFSLCFGGAHIALYFLNGANFAYSFLMTASAFASSLIFPYLIVRVRDGFIYSYMIHYLYYVLLATIFHIFPPPGFFA